MTADTDIPGGVFVGTGVVGGVSGDVGSSGDTAGPALDTSSTGVFSDCVGGNGAVNVGGYGLFGGFVGVTFKTVTPH